MEQLRLVRILTYPVKALSAQDQPEADLEPGHPLAGDRHFALALADTPATADPVWLPDPCLVTRGRFPILARLDTHFDARTGRLSIRRRGRLVLDADVHSPAGRSVVSSFFAAYLAGTSFGHPHLVECAEGFGDRPRPRLSLVLQESLDEVARLTGLPEQAAHWRLNLVMAGGKARQEQSWVGRRLRLGGAVLEIVEPMSRRALPDRQESTLGLRGLGVWAEVVAGGRIGLGDGAGVLPAPDGSSETDPLPERSEGSPP